MYPFTFTIDSPNCHWPCPYLKLSPSLAGGLPLPLTYISMYVGLATHKVSIHRGYW